MKSLILAACILTVLSSCGDMAHNTNNNNAMSADSANTAQDHTTGYPNTSGVPIRDTFNTDEDNNTGGPDNAVPKSTAMDSANSVGGGDRR